MSGKVFLSLVCGVLSVSSGLLNLTGHRPTWWLGGLPLLAGSVWLARAFLYLRSSKA